MKWIDTAIWLLVCIVLLSFCQGCAHSADNTEAPLSPKEVQSAKLLGQRLSPPSLSTKKREGLIAAIDPLEYHVGSAMGHTLIHAKFLIGDRTLRGALAGQKRENESFDSNVDSTHAFGPTSDNSFASDGDGTPERVAWWKPEYTGNAKVYFWGTHIPKKTPRTRVWLHVTEGEKNRRLVYMRVEIG